MPDRDEIELPVGTRLAEFEITSLVGVGGFGIVYKAFDHSLSREVALKEYLPRSLAVRGKDLTVTATVPRNFEPFTLGLRSFVNEAQILAKFDHPSLAKVHRFWEANGTAYMAMTFYDGKTLKEVLAGMTTPPPMNWLKLLLDRLLDALELLHRENLLHRDVAPDNILLLASGRPILLDLGAARLVLQDEAQALTVILKPGYAPPEQYAGDPSMRQGPWTDLYALAAVAHYAITGEAPMPSISRMLSDNRVPLAQRPLHGYNPDFLDGIDRALSVKPEDRPQNVAQMRANLCMEAGPVQTVAMEPVRMKGEERASEAASTTQRGHGRRIVAVTMMAGGIAILGALALFYLGTSGTTDHLDPSAVSTGPVVAEPELAAKPVIAEIPAPKPSEEALAITEPSQDPAQILQQIEAQQDAGRSVAVVLDKPVIRIGRDNLSFRVRSDKAGYLYILMVGTDGAHFSLLFPNAIDGNNRINANQELKLPRSSWALRAGGPPGINRFIAMVSEQPRSFAAVGLRKVDSFAELTSLTSGTTAGLPSAGKSPFAGIPSCSAAPDCSSAYGAALFEIEEQP